MNSTFDNRTETRNNQRAAIAYNFTFRGDSHYTKIYWNIANEIGIPEALLIQVVEDWCQSNRRKNKLGYFHEEEWWTAGTYRQWSEAYPSLGEHKTVQRLFLKLEKANYILSSQQNKFKGDSTKFYRINAEKVGHLLLKEQPSVDKFIDDANDADYMDLYGVPNLRQGSDHPRGGVVSNLSVSQLETFTEQSFQHLKKINTNIQSKQITENGTGLEKEVNKVLTSYQDPEIKSNASCRDLVELNNSSLAEIPNDLATTSTSTHEDTLCEALPENDSQKSTVSTEELEVVQSTVESTDNVEVVQSTSLLTFDSDPLKEVSFLTYFKTIIKSTRGTVIEKIYGYVAKMLSNASEGAAEVLSAFNEWKKDCVALGRKVSDVLEVEAIRQKEKYDFASWDRQRRTEYYSRLLDEGLERFREPIQFS